MQLLIRLLSMMAVFVAASHALSGVRVGGFGAALVAAVVYAVLAAVIGWLVRGVVTVLSIVPGLLTFGLFFLLVPILANTVLLKMTAGLLPSFQIWTWTAAFLLAIGVTVLDAVLGRGGRRR